MVIWSEHAREDIKHLYEYIFLDSPLYARRVRSNIAQKVFLLNKFPNMGRVVPERENQSFRELLVYAYRIIYSIRNQDVFIVTIIHSKQDFSTTFGDVDDSRHNL